MRATLRLGLTCDNRCVFCAQAGLADGAPRPALEEELRRLRAEADELSFVGGEPTLDARLPEAVAQARAAGFARVGIQTNGRHLAALAPALARAGLTDVHVSIHGAEPAVHDYHSGAPGSFAALVDGIAAARAARLTVAATTVLTRSNMRALSALPPLLGELDVAAWLVEVPRAAGRAAAAFDRVMPRLALALPFALHALDAARRLGLAALIRGAPLCRLGPLDGWRLADEPRSYGAACAACPARAACPGLDPIYLERFGGDELAPRSVAAPLSVADERARLFVGIGERAAASAAAPPPADDARRRLPLAGKVQPALREVSAAAPRRSGAELRELFPDLFRREG